MISHYDWAGGREAMLRFGPDTGPVVIVAQPLFEEANRTRTLIVSILRKLAGEGIASALPDLPGSGESLVETDAATLADWRAAFAAAAASLGRPVHVVAIRGGALVDTDTRALSRWQATPVSGADLVRELFRTRQIGDPDAPRDFDPTAPDPNGPPIELAGNLTSRALLCDLIAAEPHSGGATRVVRIGKDKRIADRLITLPPPWRTAEPGYDPGLAAMLAEDIADWVRACGG